MGRAFDIAFTLLVVITVCNHDVIAKKGWSKSRSTSPLDLNNNAVEEKEGNKCDGLKGSESCFDEDTSIVLNGAPNLAREYEPFIQGVELFSTVTVLVNEEPEADEDEDSDDSSNLDDNTKNQGNDSEEEDSDEDDDDDESSKAVNKKLLSNFKLESCSIKVYPPLNIDHEYFRLPRNFMKHLKIHSRKTKNGIRIHGPESVTNYQTILRQIVYFNRKPAFYLNRVFKLTCSASNGRINSNEYVQTLTVIHPKITSPPTTTSTTTERHEIKKTPSPMIEPVMAKAKVHEHQIEVKDAKTSKSRFLDSGLMDAGDAFARTSTGNQRLSPIVVGHAVTVIIVVCVGFLVFMIVLGVIRIRAAHHRTVGGARSSNEEDQEMSWDDTALTITVNPLDTIDHDSPDVMNGHHHEDDDDCETSSNDSYHEDGESSEGEEDDEATSKNKDMTWDDSALGF